MGRSTRVTFKLIGYWAGPTAPGWPDPRAFVDSSWDLEEREDVANYLTQGFVFRAFGGVSTCRICGVENGALELTDGVWYWPDGLAHYLTAHDVRLPQIFVDHVGAQLDRLDTVDPETDWWRAQSGFEG